jgi:hypothetical protein
MTHIEMKIPPTSPPPRPPREDDTEQRIINEEVRSCISILPPKVDKLKDATERAIAESRKLRLEARRTRDSTSSLKRPELPKK